MEFPAYLHGFRKTVVGENIISLSVDSTFSKQLSEIIEMEHGTPLGVRIETMHEIKEPEQNTDTKEKFRKMMHAKIREVAEKDGVKEEWVKNILKEKLKEKGLIEESTTELDLKGYAIACNMLDEMK